MYGIEKAQCDIESFSNEALDIISCFGEKSDFLYEYIKNLITRVK